MVREAASGSVLRRACELSRDDRQGVDYLIQRNRVCGCPRLFGDRGAPLGLSCQREGEGSRGSHLPAWGGGEHPAGRCRGQVASRLCDCNCPSNCAEDRLKERGEPEMGRLWGRHGAPGLSWGPYIGGLAFLVWQGEHGLSARLCVYIV